MKKLFFFVILVFLFSAPVKGQECCEGIENANPDCIVDSDCDGILDDVDNCPDVYNPDQNDIDLDEKEDACGWPDQLDIDGDGVTVPVFLLLRNTLITQLSSEESEFVLAQEGNIQYIDISAQVPDVPPIRELVKEVTSPRSSPSFHII